MNEQVRILSTVQGFIEVFFKHCKNATSQIQAYEATEIEHEQIFQRRKYSSYDSFRQVKNKTLKKNQ